MPQQRPFSPRKQTLSDLIPTVMVLCYGRLATGNPYWAYLALRPNDAAAFYEARKKGRLNLEDYGTVIEWAEGEAPSSEIRARMQAQYGMREDYEKRLLAAIALHGSSTA